MTIAFRPMRMDEIDLCADLWVETWSDTYPAIDFKTRRDWFVARFKSYVAGRVKAEIATHQDGQILGLVSVDPETGHVDQFAIAKHARGKGIATALMDHAKAIAPGFLHLDVNTDNHRAIRFYEREGFRRVREGFSASGRPSYFYEWVK
jgi:putative acetyltransferase